MEQLLSQQPLIQNVSFGNPTFELIGLPRLYAAGPLE
jgi:hypothetical protein